MPASRITLTAPSSRVSAPQICRCPASHCLRAAMRPWAGLSNVPTFSPSMIRCRTLSSCAGAITVAAPEPAAFSAATSLVRIPPRPNTPEPPAAALSRASPRSASGISIASSCNRGSLSKYPAWSVRMTRRSASTRLTTKAARLSLSPKRILSVADASFSLTTGTTPSCNRARSVLRALR